MAACALVVGACSFDASYGGSHYKCSDGVCPSGLVCNAGLCVTPDSGSGSGSADARLPDGPPPALTCGDPGLVGATGGTFTGTTTGRTNTVTASCSGGIMNGQDAIYRMNTTVGDPFTISITATWAASVYVISPCTTTPATPACFGSSAATPGNPLSLTAGFTGEQFIVVDALSPASDGSYTLTITR